MISRNSWPGSRPHAPSGEAIVRLTVSTHPHFDLCIYDHRAKQRLCRREDIAIGATSDSEICDADRTRIDSSRRDLNRRLTSWMSHEKSGARRERQNFDHFRIERIITECAVTTKKAEKPIACDEGGVRGCEADEPLGPEQMHRGFDRRGSHRHFGGHKVGPHLQVTQIDWSSRSP